MTGIFTWSDQSIVTTYTCALHLEVIDEEHRRPDRSIVAVFTDGRGVDVINVLAINDIAIMAADAVRCDCIVFKIRR